MNEDKWTIGHEIGLFTVIIISLTLVIFGLFYCITSNVGTTELLKIVAMRTIMISIFPILLVVLIEQYFHQRKQLKEASFLNNQLSQLEQNQRDEAIKNHPTKDRKIILKGDNNKMMLSTLLTNLIYGKSDGNYVEVYYLQSGKLDKVLIRSSLKAIEEQLASPDIFHCHKRFLINLSHVTNALGNASTLELVLEHSAEKVPVSRNKSKHLLEMLKTSDAMS